MGQQNVIPFPITAQRPRMARPNGATPCGHADTLLMFQRARGHHFLIRDKIELCAWEAAGGMRGVSRIVIHENAGTAEEDADLALLYGPNSPWARWGISRCNRKILLWRCRDGAELGKFDTVREALAALERTEHSANAAARPIRFWPNLVSGFTESADLEVVDCPPPHISAWGQTPATP